MSPPTAAAGTADVPAAPTGARPAPAGVRAVVCYLRTANPGTLGQRLLGRQRARLEAACAAHGWTPVVWVEDLHQSGTTLDRPGLQQALALLADHQAQALLATDATRLAVDAAVTQPARGARRPAGLAAPDRHPTPPPTVAPAATVVDRSPGLGPGRGGAR